MARKKKDQDKVDFLSMARERFQAAQSGEQDIRDQYSDDIAFDDGDQWSDAEKIDRKGRPCPVVNKTAGVNKQIIGDARQNRPRIKVRPVSSGSDPLLAEIFTGIIRNIENVSDAEAAYDYGHECSVRGGYGHWRVLTQYADDMVFDQDILIKRLHNNLAVYFDPNSVESDYSDARYCFIVDSLTKEEFEAQYPDAVAVDWESDDTKEDNWIFEDKIRVAEYFYKEPVTKHMFELADGRVIEVKQARTGETPEVPEQQGIDPNTGQPVMIPGRPAAKLVIGEGMEQPLEYRRDRKVKTDQVKWCKLTGNQTIEGPQDWAGRYIPVVRELGEEIWKDGKRVLRSATRLAKDPQRIYNWTRANAIEVMALGPKQPYIGTSKMFEGHEQQWDQAHRRPMNRLLANLDNGQLPQRQSLDVATTGIHNESMLASDDIKAATSVFDASLGAQGNETSGRAIIARQREGDTATFVFADNQARAIKYTGRILVDLIPRIYDTERVVRLMGDDLRKSMGQGPQTQQITVAEDGQSAWVKVNVTDPATGKIVANDLSIGRYDVVVDAGPGYQTRRIEAADGIVQLIQAVPQLAPILAPRLARNLDWPEAQEIGEEIKQVTQPQQPPPDPRIQLDMEKGKLDLQGKQLDNQGKIIDIQSRAQQAQQQGAEGDQRTYQIAVRAVSDVLKQIMGGGRPQ